MTHQNHRIALIPGDGIGTEVRPPARFPPFSHAYCKAKDKSL
jgi:hypothetical protein